MSAVDILHPKFTNLGGLEFEWSGPRPTNGQLYKAGWRTSGTGRYFSDGIPGCNGCRERVTECTCEREDPIRANAFAQLVGLSRREMRPATFKTGRIEIPAYFGGTFLDVK